MTVQVPRLPECLFCRLIRFVGVALGLAVVGLHVSPSRGQALAATVNGEPVTTVDVETRIKMLRVQRKSATREVAIDELIAEHLKFHEANRYGVDATDQDMLNLAKREATEIKSAPQAYLATLGRAGVDQDHLRNHLRTNAAWNNYVRARNKTIGISEGEIKAEMAKQPDVAKLNADYTLRQVILVLPVNAGADVVQRRMREADALRGRFTDCVTGLQLARALPETVVKEQMLRNAGGLSTELREILDRTAVGKLTPPVQSSGGIEMLAVCDKRQGNDETSVHDRIQENLLDTRLKKESDRMYGELRATAVIEKR